MKTERRDAIQRPRDPDMAGAEAALRRAARRARERADRQRAERQNAARGQDAAPPDRSELLAEADRIRAMTPGRLTDSVELLRAERGRR